MFLPSECGNLYVTDSDKKSARRLGSSANVTTVAGSPAGATGAVNAAGLPGS